MKPARRLIATARCEQPADLAIRGAKVFNVFTGEFEQKDVLVSDGYIAALFPYETTPKYQAKTVVEAGAQWLVPGFIDAHVHIESGMVCPEEFSSMAASNGVTTLIADPHEISNIFGTAGIQYMLDATEQALARVFFMLPSCVPASALEKATANLSAADLEPFFGHPRVLGMGEMMNYPGLLGGAPDVMAKLESIHRYNEQKFGPLQGLSIDGHAPFLLGADLQAYIAAGVRSDHEASTVDEALERLGSGMGLMMRLGSAARNLLDLVPAVTEHTAHLCMLCTDDRHPEDLVEEGSINFLVRKLVEDARLPLSTILKMASYNTARLFSLGDIGAIAPGYKADFALYPDLASWKPLQVWREGECVARDGAPAKSVQKISADRLRGSVVLAETVGVANLRVADKKISVKVIEVVPYQLITHKLTARLPGADGELLADPAQDIAKLAVFERHQKTGRVGVGFVKGMGMQRGAVASTIAHDSHNLLVVGLNDNDMFAAATALQQAGGGLAVCLDGKILELLPLPLAGLFSDKPLSEVYGQMQKLTEAVRSLGLAEGNDPFMTLAFLSLAVIPSLRLTDSGLVDVDAQAFTSVYAD